MSEIKKIKNLKEFSTTVERFEGGHRLCPGCSHSVIVREILNATDDNLVVSTSTGCLEVCTTIYPYTSWDVSWMHIGFENAAAGISGVEAMYKARKNKGHFQNEKPTKFIAFGGDGGTYDIGFQSLSGAAERGHNFIYVCLDNEAYANTGGQRSSSTPIGSSTTTSPAGKISYGEKRQKKDMVGIMAAHGCKYVAQVAPSKWKDLVGKIQKAYQTEGAVYINAVSPCPTEWKYDPSKSMELSDLAVDSLVFPLYEIYYDEEAGHQKLKVTYKPKKKKTVEEYCAMQGRFKHLFKQEFSHVLDDWQKRVDANWEYLLKREELGV
jgi:pyruvate ferredoxin oxidoreductase beta subunit